MELKIFITGATGHIGNHLAIKLAEAGHSIHALCRNPENARSLDHRNIQLFKGDVLNPESIEKAMHGCNQVYHLAAFAGIWAEDPGIVYSVNIEGLTNVLDVASTLNINKVVFTSTAGTLGPTHNNFPVNEASVRKIAFFNDYETSKFIAEEKVQNYVRKGLQIVIVNPSRVYGPGKSPETRAVTQLIEVYYKGKWRFIPGNGSQTGNYVYIDDVVEGHIQAMDQGKPGEKYILGGENVTYNQFFDMLKYMTGRNKQFIKIPLTLALLFSFLQKFLADNFNYSPLITPQWVKRYYFNWAISSNKAQKNLNYKITPFKEGLQKTVAWLANKKI